MFFINLFKKYVGFLYILYISEYDKLTNGINLKCFKILSKNAYFNQYITNQNDNGRGDTCNLMPYSWDFYLSGPIILFDITVLSNGSIIEKFWDLDNYKIINIPKKIIDSNKKNCSFTGTIPVEGIKYESIIDYCSIKKKSLGKLRGNTSRK